MHARLTLALLMLSASTVGCKDDAPVPRKEPTVDPAVAAPAATSESPTKQSDSYGLDTPAATEAPAQKAVGTPPTEPTPTASVPTAAPQGRKGASASGEGFEVHLAASESYEAGKKGVVTVVLNAAAPFHCNDKYPYKFTVDADPQLEYAQDVVRGMKIGESQSTMPVEFTPASAGKHTVKGTLAFSVCTDDKCLIEKQPLSVSIDVKGAS